MGVYNIIRGFQPYHISLGQLELQKVLIAYEDLRHTETNRGTGEVYEYGYTDAEIQAKLDSGEWRTINKSLGSPIGYITNEYLDTGFISPEARQSIVDNGYMWPNLSDVSWQTPPTADQLLTSIHSNGVITDGSGNWLPKVSTQALALDYLADTDSNKDLKIGYFRQQAVENGWSVADTQSYVMRNFDNILTTMNNFTVTNETDFKAQFETAFVTNPVTTNNFSNMLI